MSKIHELMSSLIPQFKLDLASYEAKTAEIRESKVSSGDRFQHAVSELAENREHIAEARKIVDEMIACLHDETDNNDILPALLVEIKARLIPHVKEERNLHILGHYGTNLQTETKYSQAELAKERESLTLLFSNFTQWEIPLGDIPVRFSKKGTRLLAISKNPVRKPVDPAVRASANRKILWTVGTGDNIRQYPGISISGMRSILGAEKVSDLMAEMDIEGKNFPEILTFTFKGQTVTRSMLGATPEEIESVDTDADEDDDDN